MSRITFIKCSNRQCKSKKPYPVDAGMEDTLKKCPQCDPKGHRAAKNAKQQANMVSNKPKSQRSFDAGRVQSLDAGAKALKEAGVNLEGEGVEVPTVHAKSEVDTTGGHKIPIISKAAAKASAKKFQTISRIDAP